MLRKAKARQVTGGRVFGYDNRDVLDATPGPDGRRRRLYVEQVVNPEEAEIVRRIFQLCADGLGVRNIAVRLNDEGVLAPQPRRLDRPRSWAPSTVREILYCDRYRGELIWNRIRKRDGWGLKKYVERPESEWLRQSAPELRIVADDLWKAAHARLAAFRAAYLRSTNGRGWGGALL